MMTLRIESFSKHWKTLLLRAAFSSVQFSCSVVSDSLRPHELQHTRPPCPSPTHGVYSNSCPLSQWCPSTISCSVVPFFCPQSFPASGSFQMSQLFASGGQSIGVSPSTSVLSMNIQTGWISLQSRDSQESSQHHSSKASILQCSAFVIVQLSHPYVTTGKTIVLTRQTFVDKVMSPLFNMLSRLIREKEMETHSSILAWRIPGTEEPGGLLSVGLHTVEHDWSNLAAAAGAWW